MQVQAIDKFIQALLILLQMLVKLFFSNKINDILYNLKSICSAILYTWEWMEMLYKFLRKVAVVQFGDQSRISKTVYGIRCAYVYGGEFKPTQTSGIELKSFNSFHKKIHLRCLGSE